MDTLKRLFVVFACLTLAACGGKKTDTPAAKPKAKSAVVEPSTEPVPERPANADAKPEPAKDNADGLNEDDARTILVGIWRVDLKSLGKIPVASDTVSEDEADALAVERQAMAMTAFEFSPEGRFTQFMGQQIFRGKYKVEKAKGNVLHINTTVAGRKAKLRVTVTEENLVLKQKGMPTLTLERGPPKIMGAAP